MFCVYENRIDVFVAYVRNELSDKELDAFEEHYLGCEQCAKQVLFFEKTTLAMNHYGEVVFERLHKTNHNPIAGILSKLDEWVGELTPAQWLRPRAPVLAGAAIMIVLLSLTFILSIRNTAPEFTDAGTTSGLFQDPSIVADYRAHIDWPDNFILESQTPSSVSRELSTLRNIYQNDRNYKLAAYKLTNFLQRYPDYGDLQLFLGASLLQINNGQMAAEILDAYLERNPDQIKARWALIGAYLQSEKTETAVTLLREIASTGDSKHRKLAQQELKRLTGE